MCGIGGIALRPGQSMDLPLHLKDMLAIQAHRGPDAEGLWVSPEGQVGLCHRRLAILDLSPTGQQPMFSTDGRYVIVFNGEIYNYRELANKLACAPVRNDTQVLLEAYRHWGEDMLLHLRGMFAFVIYDVQAGTLFAARDRVGKKPLVYAQTSAGFVFGSEIPAVRQVPGVDTHYDHAALAALLLHNLRHIPDPYTAYRGISRLPAGHALRVREGKIEKIWRYWIPQAASGSTTPSRLRVILEEAVDLRMQADVPVGALLSGGVDSSAIVALMRRRSSQAIHTYALGMDGQDEDLVRARCMAQALGTCHREFHFDPQEQWQIFKHLMAVYGEPIMLLPLVHTYALCRAIREDGIRVVLTGHGADELFYGYTGHIRTLQISRWLDRLAWARPLLAPLKKTSLACLAVSPGLRKAATYRAWASKAWAGCLSKEAQIDLPNRAAEAMETWGPLCPSSHFIDESNFVGLMVENTHSVTTAGDLPAMAASLEMRAPFLDQEMISFALATPAAQKIPQPHNPAWLKAILREAVRDLVPDALLRAPKRGFGSGIQEADVLRGPWREQATALLDNPSSVSGLFDVQAIRAKWRGFLAGRVPAQDVAKLLAIQVWCQEK
jgi:asparagine synthase (glutamine-hydrolysing)